jgi:predicted lipase
MPYIKSDALKCCSLIEILYLMIDEWEMQGSPQKEANFKWTPPASTDFCQFGSPVWVKERKWVRGHGPHGKDHWEYVRSPMIVAAATSDGRIFAGVRGTSVNPNWYTNTDFIPKKVTIGLAKNVTVHEGFYYIFNSAQDTFTASIASLAGKLKDGRATGLVVTGHSLGAALATLFPLSIFASDWFKGSGLKGMNVYALATPKAGKKNFVKAYNAVAALETFNIQNTVDVVPKVPPEALGFFPVSSVMTFTKDWHGVAANHTMPMYRAAITSGWGDLG